MFRCDAICLDLSHLGVMMAVYLISYDIPQGSAGDEKAVLAKLRGAGAVRCLFSEWLYESSDETAIQIAEAFTEHLSAADRILVVPLRKPAAYHNLQNEADSVALLNRA